VLSREPTLDADAAFADAVFGESAFADAVLDAVSALELPGSDTGSSLVARRFPECGEARSSYSPVRISRARAPKIGGDEGPSLIAERSPAG
jgi:hypothetical protein